MKPGIPATALATALIALALDADGAELTISCGWQEVEQRLCREAAEAWAAQSGHTVEVLRAPQRSDEHYFQYLDLLGRGDDDVDVLQIDVIWPSALASELVDLGEAIPSEELEPHIDTIVANNTVEGRLVAMPWYTDAGILYYRKDLLEAHGLEVPETWADLTSSALFLQAAERAAGNPEFYGFVFQGQAYEGLTCNALEWIAAHGGGRILDDDGRIAVDTPEVALALGQAAAWIGTIAPERVTEFVEEDARITFQLGNAAFMRNWPYAWSLLQGEDSPVAGKIGVAPLPRGTEAGGNAAVLGGWQLAVSRHSENQEAAIDLVRYMTSAEEQKRRAIEGSYAPTIKALYEDPELLEAVPFFADFGPVLDGAIARPSAETGRQYAQVSTLFWEATHRTLSGFGTARDNLARLDDQLELLRLRAGF